MSHAALVIPGIDRIGGAERQVILLAKGLCRRGWRISVVALTGSGGAAANELTASGVSFLSLGMRKGLADPRGWLRFRNWLRLKRPDVVHAHLPHAAWLARGSRLATSMPVLIDTLHSSSTGSWARAFFYRASAGLPDRVTAVSRAVAETHLDAGMVGKDKLIVLPNGVDVDVWRPDLAVRTALRAEFGFEHAFLWLAAGRLDPVKDYPTLLHAFAGVPTPACLIIAGTGPLQDELQQLARELGIQDRVRFLGFEANVLKWMQAADGFVQCSQWEGLPMALLEAGACSLAAVATDVPGTREVIVNGENGWLAEAGSPSSVRDAMVRRMQASEESDRAMGQRARTVVLERFSLVAVLDRWEKLYNGLRTANLRTSTSPQ